ncbi:MAG: hypothetical protein Q4A78_12755 [Peptostreptococcaceae bacterium]|nr:hypothetical protein [Peptostreptococcaceae bacterium]
MKKIEKNEPLKFQKNQQDADFRAKAAGRRFEFGLDFRRVSPIFPKESPRRRMILKFVCNLKRAFALQCWLCLQSETGIRFTLLVSVIDSGIQ